VSRVQDDVQKDFHRGFFASVLRLQLETRLLSYYFPDLEEYLQSGDDTREFFDPPWLWKALSRLDVEGGDHERTRKYRLASLFFPLLEKRLLESLDPGEESVVNARDVHLSLIACCASIGIYRREREGLTLHWTGRMRLKRCLSAGQIPIRFQKKPYFREICDWHLFHDSLTAHPTENLDDQIRDAVKAGKATARRRRRRRRKKITNP